MSRNERHHDLDALRAFAMFLGIVVHGILSFTSQPVPFWPVHDRERSQGTELALFAIHDFRMQLFFLLAGFFGAMILARYGLGGFLRHRAQRVALPFVVCLLVVGPVLQYLWLIGDLSALRTVGIQLEVDGDGLSKEAIRGHFLSGDFLRYLFPHYLWFLYFLCIFYLAMVPLVWMARTSSGRRVASALRSAQAWLLAGWYHPFVLALLTAPMLWPMKMLIVDTPDRWLIDWHLLAYYFFFFVFGWLLFAQRELIPVACDCWFFYLLVGTILFLPAYLMNVVAYLEHVRSLQTNAEFFGWYKPQAVLYGGIYTWLMVFGLMGLFRDIFAGERRWVRYLADSSYWCYLASLVPLIVLQMYVAERDWPLLVKLLFVHAVAIGLLLLSYEYLVRYTFIGAVLNGRKERLKR